MTWDLQFKMEHLWCLVQLWRICQVHLSGIIGSVRQEEWILISQGGSRCLESNQDLKDSARQWSVLNDLSHIAMRILLVRINKKHSRLGSRRVGVER